MEIKILRCVLPARVYHRCMRRNQSALQYLHSICNMRFNLSPCVQSPGYILPDLSVFTTQFYLRTCKLYMISFFTVLQMQVSCFQLVERVACSFPICTVMTSPAVCHSTWHVSNYGRGTERLQISKFFHQAWSFETSALSKIIFWAQMQVSHPMRGLAANKKSYWCNPEECELIWDLWCLMHLIIWILRVLIGILKIRQHIQVLIILTTSLIWTYGIYLLDSDRSIMAFSGQILILTWSTAHLPVIDCSESVWESRILAVFILLVGQFFP